jgi:Phytanoyl-CoA dioxygenase (PhyH)
VSGDVGELASAVRAHGLTVGAPATWVLDPAPPAGALAEALASEAYVELAPCVPPALVARCRAAVEVTVARGAPAVAALVFDAPWELFAALAAVGRAALGEDVRLLPSFWVWHLGQTGKGWEPHRDRPRRAFTADGRIASMTIWAPLTDATLRNGCIHCVPAYWDWEYRNPDAGAHVPTMQHLRALPVPAGAVLGWTHALLHWGAAAAPDAPPRISASFELIRASAPTDVPVTHPPGWVPTLDERVTLIDGLVRRYRHMHELDDRAVAPLGPFLVAVRRALT